MSDEHFDDEVLVPDDASTMPENVSVRPGFLPEKFWDPEAGDIRVEALVNSYTELERKLSAGDPAADQAEPKDEAVDPLDAEPAAVPAYEIDTSHGLFEASPDIDAVLREAGLTGDQAQLVYDLAAHVLLPVMSEVADGPAAEAEEVRLQQHFGGDERWQQVRRQLKTWGKRHLSDEAYDALSSTYDGVISLYRLMDADEPSMLRGETAVDVTDEASLRQMIRDPRYWRDRDSSIVRRVSEGFRRLYPNDS